MADEPISALTQIAAPTGTPPYSTAFTSPTTGAMLEILDTTNISMASTGTNSRIAPGDLIKGYLAAGSNVTITETSGIVTIAAAGGGVTSNYVTAYQSSANVSLAQYTTFTTACSLTLPSAGTYLLTGAALCDFWFTGSVGQYLQIYTQLYDSTNSLVVPNSFNNGTLQMLQVASTSIASQLTAPVGPVIYTVTGSAVINLQGAWNGNASITGMPAAPSFDNTAAGNTGFVAIRIA